jgi:hypothetical protein
LAELGLRVHRAILATRVPQDHLEVLVDREIPGRQDLLETQEIKAIRVPQDQQVQELRGLREPLVLSELLVPGTQEQQEPRDRRVSEAAVLRGRICLLA